MSPWRRASLPRRPPSPCSTSTPGEETSPAPWHACCGHRSQGSRERPHHGPSRLSSTPQHCFQNQRVRRHQADRINMSSEEVTQRGGRLAGDSSPTVGPGPVLGAVCAVPVVGRIDGGHPAWSQARRSLRPRTCLSGRRRAARARAVGEPTERPAPQTPSSLRRGFGAAHPAVAATPGHGPHRDPAALGVDQSKVTGIYETTIVKDMRADKTSFQDENLEHWHGALPP